MSYTVTHVEEWEEEYCSNCGHPKSYHYKEPKDVFDKDGNYLYTASGCMVIGGGTRRLKGNNRYLRCPCTKFE